jgi:hypothetical protein
MLSATKRLCGVLQMTTTFVLDFDYDNPENTAEWGATFETADGNTGNVFPPETIDANKACFIINVVKEYSQQLVPFTVHWPGYSITAAQWDSEHEPGRRTAIVSLFATERASPPPSMFENSYNPTAGSSYDIDTDGTGGTKDTSSTGSVTWRFFV